jgi:oxygen-independent coproporphyrinogen III oxidase
MVTAILKEMELQNDFLQGEEINTIYFGGGTPSILNIEDLRLQIDKIRSVFNVAQNAEITLEANPDDISKEKLLDWKTIGINRLSIGIQSFLEDDLVWMNRAHNVELAVASLKLATREFENISVDLIYGSPFLSDEQWRKNVAMAVEFGIPHLSCYALTVEEKTPLHKQIALKKTSDVDSDKQAKQFLLLMKWLREYGYEHYEVSNFAKPGFRSTHNSSYWQGKKYLGLGPSAHSYNGSIRKWNIANNNKYLNAIQKGITDSETEVLTETQKLNEYLMISLRTTEGINLDVIKTNWGSEKAKRIEDGLLDLKEIGLITISENKIILTDKGMLRADGIAADLFFF